MKSYSERPTWRELADNLSKIREEHWQRIAGEYAMSACRSALKTVTYIMFIMVIGYMTFTKTIQYNLDYPDTLVPGQGQAG